MRTRPTLDRVRQLCDQGHWAQALDAALALVDPPCPQPLVALVALNLVALSPPRSLSAANLDKVLPLLPLDHYHDSLRVTLAVATDPASPKAAHRALDHALRTADRWITALVPLSDALAEHDLARVDHLVTRGTGEGGSSDDVRNAVLARRAVLDLQDRVSSWEALYGDAAAPATEPPTPKVGQGPVSAATGAAGEGQDDDGDEDGEGWGQLDLPTDDDAVPPPPAGALPVDAPSPPPDDAAPAPPDLDLPSRPSLRTFLRQPLVTTALALAASSSLPELTLLCTLHPAALWPHRERIVDAVPKWVDPSAWVDLLPAVGADGLEAEWEDQAPWRAEPDWSEALPSLLPSSPSQPSSPSSSSTSPSPPSALPARRTATALQEWYSRRISRCASSAIGLVDVALALVQHGAARGVPGLDELGEDLSLLAKLVYERPRAGDGVADGEVWSLERWRALSPLEVLEAYTATSDAAALPDTLRRLVLPYLSVLDRIVQDDADLARVVLAALYGAGGRAASVEGAQACGTMFECLPAFADAQGDADGGADLFALAAPPSSSSSSASSAHSPPPAAPSPSALLSALRASGPRALAAHLDALDLHLSQLELLVRYSAAPPSGLAWFLAAYASRDRQAQWATRLARTAAQGGSGSGTGSSAAAAVGGARAAAAEGGFEGEDEWVALLEFMREATGVAGEEDEGEDERRKRGLGRMFCLLGDGEVLRIFFGGLLGAGRFSLARALFEPSSIKAPLEPHVVEELVIAASREFYDNAEAGNLHEGEMKLALDCLSAAPQQTPALRRERDFIEATSRLCSFRLDSRPGIPLTPIELRHAPDRLTYVARLLSSNDSAHKHPDMVLALVHGLGYPHGGAQEVRALAMLADAAIGAGSYPLAAEQCARAVRAVEALRRTASRLAAGPDGDGDKAKQAQGDADTAADHAWRACFALGKSAWSDAPARLEALGQALTLCPPERIQDLLPTWTVLEREVAQDALRSQKDGTAAGLGASVSSRSGAAGSEASAQLHGAAAVAGMSGDAARAAASAAAAGAHKVSAFLAAAAAKTADRVPSPARPETPTSPTRISAHAGAQGVQHLASETAAAASYTLRRAAAFLQGPQLQPVRPSSAQSDASSDGWHRDWDDDRAATASPASPRRATAARSPSPPPPSRFAAAFAGLADGPSSPRRAAAPPAPRSPAQAPARSTGGGGGGGGFGFGLGDRLTAGVGWLIGADEMLEREKEEAEYRRQRAESQAQSQPARSEKEEKKGGEDDGEDDDWASW
ncbi:uncharacterized protein RHOBADRAFT_40843 [Rhodotorula graminis WP1]|uniref:Sec39 domain-containing protein n=1 Tax=Rhodotorula graminis (strain WP1) TaxID=578459 RepID=A0A194SFE0_RHOGW|nr:uncharacterized protein RHOBADRAFT_40843 [Rhodotorula graminis WP1]KPV78296.1 hypothetical protein RHOBADRAFT_40843 [Rhodotorula graminis WP1]